MGDSSFHLLRSRRFAPLFVTQALNSFNDNLYRTAMLFVIAYELVPGDVAAAGTWAVVAGGLYVLPYFLFSSLAVGRWRSGRTRRASLRSSGRWTSG